MDSEDLFISQDEVRVRYRFTNHSARDQEITVSFPVPAMTASDGLVYGYASPPDLERLQFRTTVDGKPVTLGSVRRAEVKGRDVTQRLAALGWPLDWFDGTGEVPGFIKRLSPAQRAALLKEGLLRRGGEDPGELWPGWDLVTHITRKQLFPAGKTVEVTHRYVPLIGGSVGGALNPEVRGGETLREYQRRYCVDQTFLAGFDRKLAARRKPQEEFAAYGEIWISYILRSGANWRGPIGDFRLVVDKGQPDNLVSFCMDGVKKVSPTRFEVRHKNFEPTRDLDILIANWPGGEQ
jgi:hypothetical protein